MKSRRKKREEEIERLLRGEGRTREADLEFQEEVRKAAAAIVDENAGRVTDIERKHGRPWSVARGSAGAWLLAIGLGLSLYSPSLGALFILAGIAAIAWRLFGARLKKSSIGDRRP